MSSRSDSRPLQPTWTGFVETSVDGLILFEACLSGKLDYVPRRPHDRERANLIKSGSVFIYEENASGIERWTDGVTWSPSRISGNFLLYRELERPFRQGNQRRAMKRKRPQELEVRRDFEENEATGYTALPPIPTSPADHTDAKADSAETAQYNDKKMERQLIGSLVDSYDFRQNGLVRKTMSISLNRVSYHLVSYYTIEDAKQARLDRPLTDIRLKDIIVRQELMEQKFRAPIDEDGHCAMNAVSYAYLDTVYPDTVYSPLLAIPCALRPGSYGASRYPTNGIVTISGMYQSGLTAAARPFTAQPTASAGYDSNPYNGPLGFDYYNRNPTFTPQRPSNSVEQEDSNNQNSSYIAYPNAYPQALRAGPTSSAYPPMQSEYQSSMRVSSGSYGSSHPISSTPVQASHNHHGNHAWHTYHTTLTSSQSSQAQYSPRN